MVEIIGTIVNDKNVLIGFKLRGKQSDFNEIGDQVIQRTMAINELFNTRFRNNQLDCSHDRKLMTLGTFKLSNLPMERYVGNGGENVPVDNKIELLSRIIADGELVGFRVKMDGRESKFNNASIIKLAGWFTPVNFVVKRVKDTAYIQGKAGHPLKNLPIEDTVSGAVKNPEEAATAETRKSTRTAQDSEQVEGVTDLSNDFDVVQMYDILRQLGGFIIKLPDEVYNRNNPREKKTDAGFVSLGVGEIADPYLNFTDNNLNANSNFKKVGTVDVEMNGNMNKIYTYTVTTKNVFYNGENHMKKIGVGIDADKVDELRRLIGSSLSFEPITNTLVTEPIRSLRGDREHKLAFFTVDTSKIDLITEKRAPQFVLDSGSILECVKRTTMIKAANKYLNEVIKRAKASAEEAGESVSEQIFGLFSMYSKEALDLMAEAGINIRTGAFDKKAELTEDEEKAESGSSAAKKQNIEVKYEIKGYSIDKIKAADFINGTDAAMAFFDDKLMVVRREIEGAGSDYKKVISIAAEAKKGYDAELGQIRKKMWLHKTSCFVLGGMNTLKVPDFSDWDSISTRSKGATAFESISHNDLKVTLKGVNMA